MREKPKEIKSSFIQHPYFENFFLDPEKREFYKIKSSKSFIKYTPKFDVEVILFKLISNVELRKYICSLEKIYNDFINNDFNKDETVISEENVYDDPDILKSLSLEDNDNLLFSKFSNDFTFVPQKGQLYSKNFKKFIFTAYSPNSIIPPLGLRKIDFIIDCLNSTSKSPDFLDPSIVFSIDSISDTFFTNEGYVLNNQLKRKCNHLTFRLKIKKDASFITLYPDLHPYENKNPTEDMIQHPQEPMLFLTKNGEIYSLRSKNVLKPSAKNRIRFFSSTLRKYTNVDLSELISQF